MNRIDRLRDVMQTQGVDLIVLAPGGHMTWLTGLTPHADERPLLAAISTKGAGLLVPALEAESARHQTDLPFFEWSDTDGPSNALDALLSTLDLPHVRALGLDEAMRADHAALITDRLPQAQTQFTETTVGALRIRKTDEEYACLKQNAQQADAAMQAAWAAMKIGMTEKEIATVARSEFKRQDAEPKFAIIGAGPNGAMPHHQTGDTILRDGDLVVMDIGAGFEGYSSDITRIAIMGTPTPDHLKVHAIGESAVQAALAAAKPGVPASAVDQAARTVIEQAGYGDHFVHRTGHGLGSETHEPPYITGSSTEILDEGMVFSIEPGIYLPGKFGLRLEEIVILRADGPEILSDLPRDLRIID